MFRVTAQRDSDNSFRVCDEPSKVGAGYSIYEFVHSEDSARINVGGRLMDMRHLVVEGLKLVAGEQVSASLGDLTSTPEDGTWLGPCDVVFIPQRD